MRRLLNLAIFLVVVAIVGLALIRVGFLPPPDRWTESAPVASPTEEPRVDLHLAVADRPERYLLGAVERLLEADRANPGNLVRLPYNPDTVWLQLNAGELDLVVTALDEAVRGLSLVPGGRMLFFSGLSVGYDQVTVLADREDRQPTRLGYTRGSSQQLFLRLEYPEAEMIPGRDQRQLERWLLERLLDGVVLESDKLQASENGSTVPLLSTSEDRPLPTVVVLSERMVEQQQEQAGRWETLKASLESWNQLVGYLEEQPELLKATLRRESQGDGVDIDRLLEDYRFLAPTVGRGRLLEAHRSGRLRQAFELLVVAWVDNLVHPDWARVLTLPEALESYFPEPPSAPGETPPAEPEVPAAEPEVPVQQPTEQPEESAKTEGSSNISGFLGTHHTNVPYSLVQPPVDPVATLKVRTGGLRYPPAIGQTNVAAVKEDGLGIYDWNGRAVAAWVAGGVLTTRPVTIDGGFAFGVQGALIATDEEGTELWRAPVEDNRPITELLLAGDLLIFATGGEEPTLYAVRSTDGVSRWRIPLASEVASTPVITGPSAPRLHLLLADGKFQTYRLSDGESLWVSALPSPTFLPMAAGADRLAVVWPEGRVAVHSSTDGSMLWSSNLGASLATGPTLVSGTVVVPSKDTYLYLLDLENHGRVKQKIRLGAALSQPCRASESLGLVADESGQVHAIDFESDALLWTRTVSEQALVAMSIGDSGWALSDRQGQVFLFQAATE